MVLFILFLCSRDDIKRVRHLEDGELPLRRESRDGADRDRRRDRDF